MDRNRHPELGSKRMEQARMTSSLVMDVEAGPKKCSDYLFGLENRELGRHAQSGLWDGNRYPLRRYFSDVARNGFTSL